VRYERSAKSRYVRLEAMRRRSRGIVSPDLVDQAFVRDDFVRSEEKCRENGALLAAAQFDRFSVDLGLERPEDAKPEWF
jgi:hypothetical protein